MASAPFKLRGRLGYRLISLLHLYQSLIVVSIRRMFYGPILPSWNWNFEVSVYFLRKQTVYGFNLKNIEDSREFDDALVFHSDALTKINRVSVNHHIKGDWYFSKQSETDITILYLHGGGYAYYTRAHHNMIALFALAANAKVFALDYRLIPEHPFPSQIDDALNAYEWLVETGIDPKKLVIMGDSAGGNLALSLLIRLRDLNLAFPALTIAVAPWTDVCNSGDSLVLNEKYDWVEKRMTEKWAAWLCKNVSPSDPKVSPFYADLKDLAPIYIQAGGAEILFDQIIAFVEKAKQQGAEIMFDVWPEMIHDFQAYGDMIPESKDALKKIGAMVKKFTQQS